MRLLVILLLITFVIGIVAQEVKHDDDIDDIEVEDYVEDDQVHSARARPMGGEAPPKRTIFRKPSSWDIEIACIGFLVVFGINFLYGRRVNMQTTRTWAAVIMPVLEKNFSSIKGGKYRTIVKDSQSDFKFYSTGRRHCLGLLATLRLKRRHDLTSYVMSLFAPMGDTMTVDVPMDENMPSVILAACQKKVLKKLRERHEELALLTAMVPIPGLPKKIVAMADIPEAAEKLLSKNVTRLLEEHAHLFQSMVISDQNAISKHPRTLRFVFNIPKPEEMGHLATMLKMVCRFIDTVSELKVSAHARGKAQKARAELKQTNAKSAHQQRQEEAEERAFEKKKKRAENISKLSKAEQRKLEERDEKIKRRRQMFKGSKMSKVTMK